MFGEVVKRKLMRLDVYRKLPQDLTESTVSGALVSVVAVALMGLLFLSELNSFLTVTTTSEMFVDINRGGELLTINIDLTFTKFPCYLLSLDAQDVLGTHVENIKGSLRKTRLDAKGNKFQQEDMLKEQEAVNLEIAKAQVKANEGCQIVGFIQVNKVPGNFHISMHAHHDIIMQAFDNALPRLDLSHKIGHISFGENRELMEIRSEFQEGVLTPLDGIKRYRAESVQMPINYEYYIKVVPTTYHTLAGKEHYVHQFTVNTNEVMVNSFPAVYFRYDLSPVTVRFTQVKESFFHFMVQVCAIVGGLFTVAGLVDSMIHSSMRRILKKADAGKLG